MKDVLEFLTGFLTLSLWVGSVIWAHYDAKSRGKPGWKLALLVMVLWPLALGVWFAVRPNKKS